MAAFVTMSRLSQTRHSRYLLTATFLVLSALTTWPAHAHPNRPDPVATDQHTTSGPADTRPDVVWGCPMCETVRQERPGQCPMCGMGLVRVDGAAGPGEPEGPEGGAAPLMPGVPVWLFYVSGISILTLSFILFELWGRRRNEAPRRGRRWNMLHIGFVRAMAAHPRFRLVLQLPVVLLFVLVVFAGLFGNRSPERNIAPVLTWTIWWTWLVMVIIFLGKMWCTACPWMAIADWLAWLGFKRREHHPPGLEKRWPRSLRNIWLATLFFVALTWLELGFGVTNKPWLTATLGLFMVVTSVGTILVFERKGFCRYACLVGRVSGLYSMFAASELRAADPQVCRSCSSHDCYHGNGKGDPCPTEQFMGTMDANTYCIMCMECVRSCPKQNIAWNVRPWGADLVESRRTRVDEAYLAVIMLSMSAFHGLTMTPTWDVLVAWVESVFGVGWLMAFSLGMAGMILLPLAVYYGICVLMKWFAGDREHKPGYLFMRFAYSLLPIALFYHLAHNLQHIFFEGKKLIRVASDPFGWGWNLFGTAGMLVDAMLPLTVGWGIQVTLILIGHLYGIFIAHKVASSLYSSPRAATLSQIPMLAGMLLFSFQSLWLLTQPMMMRTAM